MRVNIQTGGSEVIVNGRTEVITAIVHAIDVMEQKAQKESMKKIVTVSNNISKGIRRAKKSKEAKKVKQEVMLNTRWSSKEVNLIKKFYGMKKSPFGYIKKRNMKRLMDELPHRSKKTIQAKAFNLGLTTRKESKEQMMRRLLLRSGVNR
jgi:glycyl-tRNA synthetase beta subunit